MTNKACFILGAGLGTRMGKIGKVLPKILWPVFEKTLLELQIAKANELGFQKIYLNTHFHAELIKEYIEKINLDVEILFEKTLLDSGGAFHNLKNKINYEVDLTKVLFLNGDIITGIKKRDIHEAEELLKNNKIVLISKKVNEKNIYNQIVEKNKRMMAIIQAEDSVIPYFTYSGMGLINLEKLEYVKGASRFFDTVANYKNDNVGIYQPQDYEYFDFGTKDEYFKNIFSIFENKKLYDLLEKYNSIDKTKYSEKLKSYNSATQNMINLTNKTINQSYSNTIILQKPTISFSGSGIYSSSLYEPILHNHQQ